MGIKEQYNNLEKEYNELKKSNGLLISENLQLTAKLKRIERLAKGEGT